jgi:hypothetical protein
MRGHRRACAVHHHRAAASGIGGDNAADQDTTHLRTEKSGPSQPWGKLRPPPVRPAWDWGADYRPEKRFIRRRNVPPSRLGPSALRLTLGPEPRAGPEGRRALWSGRIYDSFRAYKFNRLDLKTYRPAAPPRLALASTIC